MSRVNMLILRHLKKEYVDQISHLDSRLIVIDLSDPDHLPNYLPIDGEEMEHVYKETEIIFTYRTPPNLLQLAPNLKWIQLSSAGFEHLDESILRSDIEITNSSGVHGISIAEHILMLMLMFLRKAQHLLNSKNHHQWKPYIPVELRGRTIVIIGMGHLGLEVANMARALGMNILATDIIYPSLTKGVAGIEVMSPPHLIHEMLSKSDFVVITVPQTKQTEALIGENELKSMKRSAYIINVSRGPIIDEGALVKALEEGWISGAGLDVFNTEPLPPDNKLWDLPNVIISPHIAGSSDQHDKRLTDLVCTNIMRYLNGEHLLNIVKG